VVLLRMGEHFLVTLEINNWHRNSLFETLYQLYENHTLSAQAFASRVNLRG